MATKRHELIDELLVTRRQAQRLAISLRFQGLDNQANQAREKEEDLTAQIDRLLAAAMETWIRDAEALTARLQVINQKLTSDVESVRRRERTSGHIAGALGAIDEALATIARLVP